MLDDRRAAVDPVAAVDVRDAVDLLDGGSMDMAANHAIQPALLDAAHDRLLEVVDEADRRLHFALGIPGERPVPGHAEAAPHPGEQDVEPYQERVAVIAEQSEPPVALGHDVELVAM